MSTVPPHRVRRAANVSGGGVHAALILGVVLLAPDVITPLLIHAVTTPLAAATSGASASRTFERSAQEQPPLLVTPPNSRQSEQRSRSGAPPRPAQPAPDRPIPPALRQQRDGRLFPPLDLGLLEGPDREAWQKPDQIMDVLGIADGATVADLGAGGGWFTIRLARRVGPNGLVYAQDIQEPMIEAIKRRVQRENLQNVRTVLGTETDPRLPRGLDAVLIVNSYHEMDVKPEVIQTLLRNIARVLKPQGRIGVIDFTPGDGGPGPAASERADPEKVINTAAAAGLQLQRREIVPPYQFLLVFGRDPGAVAQ
jgi:SAM-dependent methyltransferase